MKNNIFIKILSSIIWLGCFITVLTQTWDIFVIFIIMEFFLFLFWFIFKLIPKINKFLKEIIDDINERGYNLVHKNNVFSNLRMIIKELINARKIIKQQKLS